MKLLALLFALLMVALFGFALIGVVGGTVVAVIAAAGPIAGMIALGGLALAALAGWGNGH